jgi:hypothetical protein
MKLGGLVRPVCMDLCMSQPVRHKAASVQPPSCQSTPTSYDENTGGSITITSHKIFRGKGKIRLSNEITVVEIEALGFENATEKWI